MNPNTKKILHLKVHGTKCRSCEVLINQCFRAVHGVERVSVDAHTGRAIVVSSRDIDVEELNRTIRDHGYSVSLLQEGLRDEEQSCSSAKTNTARDYFEIGSLFLILLGIYLLFQRFDLLPDLGVTEGMSYGFVFLIGLVAATSTCMAVTGGLLVAVCAKYNERYTELSGSQKFKPHIFFNIGRIVSYTAFGALIGLLGSVITISSSVTGYLTILISLVMILVGFQLLNLFPGLKRFQPRMPRFISQNIHTVSSGNSRGAPFVLGGMSFFLPCGFTLALQLYVLNSGSALTGALTMLFFSLGTLPGLLSLGALTSFAKGTVQRHALRFAGALVILLGFFNISNGFALSLIGSSAEDLSDQSFLADLKKNSNVVLKNGVQIAEMKVNRLEYSPNRFTVVKGVPVEWQIDGRKSQGCGRVINMPKIGLVKYLSSDGITIVRFTPQEVGVFDFNCSMGMMTRDSAFVVIPNNSQS